MSMYNEEEYNKPLSLKIWAKMLPFLKPYRKPLITVIVLMMISALIDVLFPILQGYAVNNFITPGTTEGLFGFGAVYLSCILVQMVIVILFARLAHVVEMNVGKDMKRDTFVHLQTLSFTYYNTTPVGYLVARTISDTNRIAGLIAWGMVDALWALCYVIGAFVSMFLLNARLALIVVLVVPFIVALTIFFQNKILHLNRKIRRINSQITGAFNEGIVGAKTTKTIVIEEQNEREFSKITGEMAHKSIKAARMNAIYIPLIMLFSSTATALVLAQGGMLVMEEALLFGTFSAFISYAVGIFEPIQQIARMVSEIISAQANIERVTELLNHKADIVDKPEVIEKYGDAFEAKKENWEPIRGDIEFRDVSFKYPDGGEYVLEHFNLKIPAGQNIAIVGETGAGKSTLVNLACRFFEPTEGQILIDGVDYRERSQLWLHSNIGYVLQSPHLFSGSVRENIRYGKLDATDEEIERVAKKVSADVVVSKLEHGYDSDVGEGGDKLSTGEKQLISFARAVLADPRIFVLDEATSSIDTQTEKLIQDAIAALLENRTSFLIAHRLSTIRHADLILVVKAGKIIEQGTHEELIAKKGYYFSLYNKQFEEEAAMRLLNTKKEQ